jgi:hypothetical protein
MLVHPDKNPTMTDRAQLAFEGMYIKIKISVYLLYKDILLLIIKELYKKIFQNLI